jgi:hypothetical protein
MSGIFEIDGVNWDSVELPGSGGGLTLPPGFWPAVILNVSKRSPRDGAKPEYICMEMKVSGTDHEGVVFNDNFHIAAENEIARRIAHQRIKSLAIACGLPPGTGDESKYIGTEVIVEVRATVNKKTNEPVKNVHAYHNAEKAVADGIAIGPTGQLIGAVATKGQEAKIEAPPVKAKPWKKS